MNITNIHHVEGGVITQPNKAIQKINIIKNKYKNNPLFSVIFTGLLINGIYDIVIIVIKIFVE